MAYLRPTYKIDDVVVVKNTSNDNTGNWCVVKIHEVTSIDGSTWTYSGYCEDAGTLIGLTDTDIQEKLV